MSTKEHPLFQQYPLKEEQEISVGKVPTPYHIYDGRGFLMGGTADLSAVRDALAGQNVQPIPTTDGRAVMGAWVVDFSEASLGPHNELQFSILVSRGETEAVDAHPLTMLKALFINPSARMLCFGLWNNTAKVVAYNRELLGLDARLNTGTIESKDGYRQFHFLDEDDQLIFEGRVREQERPSPKVGFALARLLGFRNTMKAFSQPYLGAKVVNPISDAVPYNGDAQSFLASDQPVVKYFYPATDSIAFGETPAAGFDFRPDFVEFFSPFRFVYLEPERV